MMKYILIIININSLKSITFLFYSKERVIQLKKIFIKTTTGANKYD